MSELHEEGDGVSQHDELHGEATIYQPTAISASVPQAYRSVFNETLAPPNAPLSRAVRPPVDFPPESKRGQLIEDAEVDLEQDMDELKRAVHDYNVEFQRRVDDVKMRGQTMESRIRSEYESMEESMNQLQHVFMSGFQTAFRDFEQKALAHFALVESRTVADEERKIRECNEDARSLYYTTVPEIMENLQGTITRKLAKSHETFDIENAKTQKRERKTLSMMENNEKQTTTNFSTERDRRVLKFREREEEFHHLMRANNRACESQQVDYIETLVSLQNQLGEERRVREQEDLDMLDKLAESFHRLQSSILENLGEQSN